MIDKKYRLIVAFVTFEIFVIAFLTYFSFSLLRLLDLFNTYYQIKEVEFRSLNLVKSIGGLVISSFCLPLSILMGYLTLKEKREDRNILNCYAVLNIVFSAFRIAIEFLFSYLYMKTEGTHNIAAVFCTFFYSFSFIFSLLTFFCKNIFAKRIFTYAYCLFLLASLFSSLPNVAFGFPLACCIIFLFSTFAVVIFNILSMPWEKGRIFPKDQETKDRIKKVKALEKEYDDRLINEDELYLKYNELNNIKKDNDYMS